MVKITFTNAEVRDDGYGLEVNGTSLEDIISMALGTKAAKDIPYGDPRREKLNRFRCNSCDVLVVITPNPKSCEIEDEENVYNSVDELREVADERVSEEATEAESES